MKNHLLIFLSIIAISTTVFAKKVKFAVDMSNETISPTGIHVAGNFQVAAGYPSDFCPDCTPMLKEGSSNIYSVVVNIPAFKKYEYVFINGDQLYDVEFIPVESRISYDFNDNRWIYVDSVANDTSFTEPILFAKNAPANKFLVRFSVDLQKQSIDAKGVHLAGDFQSWSTTKNILYHFSDAPAGKYEQIAFVSAGTYQYKYYNGNTTGGAETVPATCASNGNRSLSVSADVVLNLVCFSSCASCGGTGIAEHSNSSRISLYPNPVVNECTLSFNNSPGVKLLVISDALGKVLRKESITADVFTIKKENLQPGIYFVHVLHASKGISTEKLIIE